MLVKRYSNTLVEPMNPPDREPREVREIAVENAATGRRVEGWVVTGGGRAVVEHVARLADCDGAAVLERIVRRLLVQKGADWTSVILSEYLGLYDDSQGTFALVWDKQSRQLLAHGAVFQSASHPAAALVAHIRTADEFKTLGLGTLVTEEVTRAALDQGAEVVVLATDDKLHRVEQGERAAYTMYGKLGYAIVAEKNLADTVDWLMVVDRPIFELCQGAKHAAGGRFPREASDEVQRMQRDLVDRTRARMGDKLASGRVEPVGDGDLANLFLLMNLAPGDDFRLKLGPWGVHHGPELERAFIVAVRPALSDRDRLAEASLTLRNEQGAVLAVCAASRVSPLTRNTMKIDFYCLPEFLENNASAVASLVEETIGRIERSELSPRPCRLSFVGVDAAKMAVFEAAGFAAMGAAHAYYAQDGQKTFEAREYVRER